jgi:methionyl-tRNA formyltransferase
MKIQLLCDNPHSWMVPYAENMKTVLLNMGHDVRLIFIQEEIKVGDILVLLSCENVFRNLSLNKHNLVIHESALPEGKGWSPLTWQVLKGENKVAVTLFEATERVDDGPIYGQIFIEMNGSELIDELREKQAIASMQLLLTFLKAYPAVMSIPQSGESSYYPRRRAEDSKLDEKKTIAEQFNLLRVCDNDRYPAFFEINGEKYILKIYKKK